MNEEIFLRLDPYNGWLIVVKDQWGNEQNRVWGAPTLEEAMRRFCTDTGQRFELRLVPVRS